MVRWAAFTVFAWLLTILLLLLARQSRDHLEAVAASDGQSGPSTDSPAASDGVAKSSSEQPATDRSLGDPVIPEFEDSPHANNSQDPDSGDWSTSQQTRDDRSVLTDSEPASPNSTPGEGGNRAKLATDSLPQSADSAEEGTGGPNIELTSRALLLNVAVTQGLVIVLLVAAAWYFSIPAAAFGVSADAMNTGLPAIAIGLAFGTLLWVGNELSTAVADAVGAAYDESVRELLAPKSVGGWLLLFGAILPIIAIAEELLFRAALIGVPAAGFGVSPWLLALGSSLVFALGHGAQGTVGIVVTGLLGFVLATAYILSGSLLLVIVAHYVINALEFYIHEYRGVEDVVLAITPTPLGRWKLER